MTTKHNCPKDCPNRRAVPNCHNVETCEIWAAHVRELEELHELVNAARKAHDDAYLAGSHRAWLQDRRRFRG